MNISIQAVDLKRLIKKLSAVQGSNLTIGNGLHTSDDSMGVYIHGFETNTPVTVSSRLFSSICNKLSGQVIILKDGGSLLIKAGKFAASIPVLKDNPTPVTASPESELKIDTKVLIDLLTFASSVTEEKSTFDHTGAVQLSFGEERLEATATDNLRIAVASIAGTHKSSPLLIPAKVIRAIKDLDGEQTTISQSESSIYFRSGDTTIYTRKLNKKFPDVNRVFPKSYKLEVEIKTQDFLDILQRVSPTIDVETAKVPIVWLDFQGDVLKVKTGNGLIGKSQDEISITQIVPDTLDEPYPIVITVNMKFLIDGLTSLKKCDTISLLANQSAQPFLIKAGNRKILIAGVRT